MKAIYILAILLTACASPSPSQPPVELTEYEKQKKLDGQKCAYEADLTTQGNDVVGFRSLGLIARCMKLKGY